MKKIGTHGLGALYEHNSITNATMFRPDSEAAAGVMMALCAITTPKINGNRNKEITLEIFILSIIV